MAGQSEAATPFDAITAAAKLFPGPAWLTAARQGAIGRFALAGLPTTRIEGWRATPLPNLGARTLLPGLASAATRANSLVEPFRSDDAVRLVFVDGLHSAELSSPESRWPAGVHLEPISRVLSHRPDDLRAGFGAGPRIEGAMHDLNTAAFRDGANVVIEDERQVEVELRIVVVATSTEPPVSQHLRNLVHVGRGARLRLTIAVIGDAGASGFINNRTEISMAERSRLDLVRIHESPLGVPHFDALSATLSAHAILNDTLLQTGPSWMRSEIDVVLSGERATADLGGVFLARGTQVSDVHTVLSHQAAGVTSRQTYRGLADDEARGVFHGQIKVESEARGADATQSNKNMLLSKRAQVHSTPALEILTDDVKCKHGSATGQIDEAQLFYLRSRGLDLKSATRILTRAFAGEILSRLSAPSIRSLVEGQITPSLDALGAAA